MTIGNLFCLLMSGLGIFNMTTDDFGPFKIWFTIPGVILMALIAGFAGDWIQGKMKGKNESKIGGRLA